MATQPRDRQKAKSKLSVARKYRPKKDVKPYASQPSRFYYMGFYRWNPFRGYW